VLITLVIIGVIAALTIPNLMKNYQTHVYKTAYKRAYADINNALKMITAEEDIETPNSGYSTVYGELFKKVSQKFKAAKTCFENNTSECWEYDGEAGYIYNGEPEWKGSASYTYAFIDHSGRAWYMYSKSESAILYDYNGKKGPNQLGKDRMYMEFQNKNNNWSVITRPDYTYKGRWCPSGECYYRSWILNK